MNHAQKSNKVDISGSRPHEIEQNIVTVTVGIWCTCGRRVQGTQKLAVQWVGDDDALRKAIESAERKAKAQLENHVESEAA